MLLALAAAATAGWIAGAPHSLLHWLIGSAIAAAAGRWRWLELRLAEGDGPGWSRAAGLFSVSAMLLIGIVLVFCQETLV